MIYPLDFQTVPIRDCGVFIQFIITAIILITQLLMAMR
jgi:hypothetical protein